MPPKKKEQLGILFDIKTGTVDDIAIGYDGAGKEKDVRKKNKKKPNKHIKDIIPCAIYTHTNSNCITFVFGGYEYTYCWG